MSAPRRSRCGSAHARPVGAEVAAHEELQRGVAAVPVAADGADVALGGVPARLGRTAERQLVDRLPEIARHGPDATDRHQILEPDGVPGAPFRSSALDGPSTPRTPSSSDGEESGNVRRTPPLRRAVPPSAWRSARFPSTVKSSAGQLDCCHRRSASRLSIERGMVPRRIGDDDRPQHARTESNPPQARPGEDSAAGGSRAREARADLNHSPRRAGTPPDVGLDALRRRCVDGWETCLRGCDGRGDP